MLQPIIAPPRCAGLWLWDDLELNRQPVSKLGIDTLGLWPGGHRDYGCWSGCGKLWLARAYILVAQHTTCGHFAGVA
jgi:hypothetical protein